MRQLRVEICRCASVVVILYLSPVILGSTAMAQKTVVVDAAGGMKQELVYDSSGRVVETRVLGANGNVKVRSVFDFPAGFYAERRHTTTSYGPDGETVQSVSSEDYDENANFIQEVIALYDSQGKQMGGHKLTHDPMTGIYRCWSWDAAKQRYKTIQCPSGEEESKPEELKGLTLEQAKKQLAAAQSIRTAEKPARVERRAQMPPWAVESNVELGLIFPARLIAGERVSGSIVVNPSRYQGVPDLAVVRLTCPAASAAGASLSDWTIEVPGAAQLSTNSALTFVVPRHTREFNVVVRQAGDPDRTLSRKLRVSPNLPERKADKFPAYRSAALCVKNDV